MVEARAHEGTRERAAAKGEVSLPRPMDLVRSTALWRTGAYDPTQHVDRGRVAAAFRTPEGPATLSIRVTGQRAWVEGWGPGAGWAVERASCWLNPADDPSALRTERAPIAKLRDRFGGLYLTRAPSLFDTLIAVVLQQRVTFREAAIAHGRIMRRLGEPAPGPFGLRVAPVAARLAELPYYAYHPLGVERRRAETLRRIATVEALGRLEPLRAMAFDDAGARLRQILGVGPWTEGLVRGIALGDPDAVPVGDLHLPREIGWLLARERGVDDARMLALLEPYRGQRWRVLRLLLTGARRARAVR